MYKIRGIRKDTGLWMYSRSVDDRGPLGVWMKTEDEWVEVISGTVGRCIGTCEKGKEEVFEDDLLCFINGSEDDRFLISFDEDRLRFVRSVWGRHFYPINIDIEMLAIMKKVGTVFDLEYK